MGVGGLVRPEGPDGHAFAATTPDGSCGFFEHGSRLCTIHRVGGQALLPVTCQMFPRVVLRDSRGAFISLSHYCPTAAGLLFDMSTPASIVQAPASLVSASTLEGLDATDTWAPLLRPGVLMDVDSYGEWERLAIDRLTADGLSPWHALDSLERTTASIVDWCPGIGAGPLSEHVQNAFGPRGVVSDLKLPDGALAKLVRDAVSSELTAPAPPDDLALRLPAALEAMERDAAAICRWLAARLFGTWIAYQGNGLRTIVRYLRAALDVLSLEVARGARDGAIDQPAMLEAVRRSDYLIIHLAGSQRLATLLS